MNLFSSEKRKAVSVKTHGFLVCPRARGCNNLTKSNFLHTSSLSARAWVQFTLRRSSKDFGESVAMVLSSIKHLHRVFAR